MAPSMPCDTREETEGAREGGRECETEHIRHCMRHIRNLFQFCKNKNNSNNFPPIEIRFGANNKHIEIHTFLLLFRRFEQNEKQKY